MKKRKLAEPISNVVYLDIVDQLGFLKAEIATLQLKEEALKNKIIAKGYGKYEGKLFRATAFQFSRETIDLDAVRAILHPDWLKEHTNTSEPIDTVRVVARKTS